MQVLPGFAQMKGSNGLVSCGRTASPRATASGASGTHTIWVAWPPLHVVRSSGLLPQPRCARSNTSGMLRS